MAVSERFPSLFLSLLLIASLLFASCTGIRKTPAFTELQGTWQLISITDRQTGRQLYQGQDSGRAIELTWKGTAAGPGTVEGRTQTNSFGGTYTLHAADSLSVSLLRSTRVMETPRGQEFMTEFSLVRRYRFPTSEELELSSERKTLLFRKK